MDAQTLKEELFNQKRSGWEKISNDDKNNIFQFAEEYMYYLNHSKTEKEIVESSKEILIKNNFKDIKTVSELHPGDRIFFVNKNRNIFAAVIGEDPITTGLRVVAAHADSPRIDLKQNPLYENSGFAYLKTHYYGGIRKYQWATIPLAMHGLIVKSNGDKINITYGEDETEPTLMITDLPPHLSQAQDERKLKEGITGEELNIMVGSIHYSNENISEKIKLNVLNILNEKYGIKEIDFTTSELEFVPAFKARSMGFDSSMVASYGQDDKVCSYTALRGILNLRNPKKTAICVLTDREEVGFMGVSGMESRIFETFILEILEKRNENSPNALNKAFSNSKALSADVDAAQDPNYPDVFDKYNSSKLGHGVCIVKYGGARGKSGSSESPAEFVAEVKKIFDENNISYHSSELGKVDKGGGGTIALTLANRGMEVLDCGVPILCMHSPYEICSKYDIYQAYRAYEAFYKG